MALAPEAVASCPTWAPRDLRSPAAGLLAPVPLVGLVVLVLNDHWWKAAYGGWWTGKLSDVAGLLFFPLFLAALVETGRALTGRGRAPSRRVLLAAAAATALVFASIKVWIPAAEAYRFVHGALWWPFMALGALVKGRAIPELARVALVMDPTDLLALPAVAVSVWSGWGRGRRGEF